MRSSGTSGLRSLPCSRYDPSCLAVGTFVSFAWAGRPAVAEADRSATVAYRLASVADRLAAVADIVVAIAVGTGSVAVAE